MNNHKYIIVISILIFLYGEDLCADSGNINSLFSYNGTITTPTAYISNAYVSFHYSYFSESFPINQSISEKKSDIWLFSSNIGLLPFLDVFFSVYVTPSININNEIDNYGSDKWRSGGVKLRLTQEKKILPAISAGITDPKVDFFGADISSPNVMSRYIVASKQLLNESVAVSIGYGFSDTLRPRNYARLKHVFGGCSYTFGNNFSLLCDYDGSFVNGGLCLMYHNIDIMISVTEGSFFASRVGYNINLLK